MYVIILFIYTVYTHMYAYICTCKLDHVPLAPPACVEQHQRTGFQLQVACQEESDMVLDFPSIFWPWECLRLGWMFP